MAGPGEMDTRRVLVLLSVCCGYLPWIQAIQVTLLDTWDTVNGQSLNWQTHTTTIPPQPGTRVGWREGSYNTDVGDTIRVYQVCNVDFEGVNNWVRTPYIPRGNAHRLYIEIQFTMRKCTIYPNPENLQQCKESFKLLYYEAESDFGNEMRPTWDSDTYTHVDVVAADETFVESVDSVVNTEIRSVPVTKEGVYFAFHDEGACTSLISVRIYNVICPEVTLNFAIFPDMPTGEDSTAVVQAWGTCVEHAAEETQPSYLCKADGSWNYLSGGCRCLPSYEPLGDYACTACPPGTYKWQTGSEPCSLCPEHSVAPNNGSVECECEEGYYRAISDDKSTPCTQGPSEIRNISIVTVDTTWVNITWLAPTYFGGRRDNFYDVECIGCSEGTVYTPGRTGFNKTYVMLSGLSYNTEYKVIVEAHNGVSDQAGVAHSVSIIFTTQDITTTRVQSAQILSSGEHEISISWEPPANVDHVEQYEVKYYSEHHTNNMSSVFTMYTNYTFRNLAETTRYTFEIRGRTADGWGEFSHPITAVTGSIVQVNLDNPIGLIAGSAVAVVVCMIIVIMMVIIFFRRNPRPCNEKNVSDCDTLQYSNVQCPSVEGAHVLNGGLTVPLFTPPGVLRSYIDPHTYEDPNQAVREFTKEIDASLIVIESVIGGGEFGDVCKGVMRMPNKGELTVAIKTLKAGASDKNRLDFLTEASIMGQFDDPNVIYLEGVVTKSNPIMIVTEYMENGSMDSFLRNNDGKFTVIQLTGMMRGVAAGMRYLSEMGYVHRDLAARNILVNESLVCKVADFGLSREIEADNTDGAYTTKGGKIPVRWTAPEAIAYRKFTSASDVWSYGVVMWETMSYGERPYWNWSNQDVIKAVDKGFRLPPPMDCPEAIYQLMLDCWQKERSHRPKFVAIVKTLDKLIRSPELLRKIAKPRQPNYLDNTTPDMTHYASIEEWLTALKMERYLEHFLQSGFTSMDQVSLVTLKDLTALGVTLVGHQKKIMNSIQTLRAQMYGAQVSEGFLV